MAIKKSEIYSQIWAACDKLRGGVEPARYKDYILTLLFVKYVSDRFKSSDNWDIEVPEGGSFDDIIALKYKKNIGEGINIIMGKLAEANDLKGIIDIADFNSEELGTDKEAVDKLSGLVEIFQKPELDFTNNRAGGDDILGDAYEFLMRKFAQDSGKSKGQFYTPGEVSRIMAKVIGIDKATDPSMTVYDPACGSGSLLIRAADEAPCEISIYGQEKDNSTAGLARMNLVLHNKGAGVIVGNKSTLSAPQYKDENNPELLKTFNYIVVNPPFSDKSWMDGITIPDSYGRYSETVLGVPPEKNGDYAWLLHVLKSLKSTGKAAVILPHGVLFRGNAEADIRKKIIDRGYIKGIIGLPANLFYGTGIPACILVLDKEDAADRTGIFMIDASKGYVKDGNKNRLREQDIHKIVTTFLTMDESDPKYARFVPNEEIKVTNEYNLNIPRYIDSSEPEDLQDINAHLNGGIPETDVDSMAEYWAVYPSLKEILFQPLRPGYLRPAVGKDEVVSTITSHPEFIRHADQVDDAYAQWKETVTRNLMELSRDIYPKELIAKISEQLLDDFAQVPLLDKYDVYEVLMEYWAETMQDDVYAVCYDGYKAGREIAYEYVTKKKKENGQTIEVKTDKIKGFEGKLLPKALIAAHFFEEDVKALDTLRGQLDEVSAKLEELAEENGGEEGLFAQLDDLKKAIISARIKAIKKDPAAKEELAALKEYMSLLDVESNYKKAIKQAEADLDTKLEKKYPQLTLEEIRHLLVEEKWFAAIYSGIDAIHEALSHHLSARVTQLVERYEYTLKECEDEVDQFEAKVKAHLERMGVCMVKYRLKDLFNLFAGGDIDTEHFSQYKTPIHCFPIYSNSLNNKGLYGYTSVPKYKGNAITITGRGSVGHAEYRKQDFDAIIRLLILIPKKADVVNSYYLTQFINQYVSFPLESTGVPQLTVPQIENIEVELPDFAEQATVAEALSDIDSLISSLQKLIEKKKAIKQGAMQELLTGKKRLPGFSGEWEKNTLKQICEFINGRAYSQHELLSRGKYKVLRLGNLFTNSHWYYTDLELGEKQYCKTGDLLYAWSASFGPTIWDGEKSVFHYHIWKIKCSETIDKKYLYHFLNADVSSILNELQGGTMSHLTKENMENRLCSYPKLDEQQAIAQVLSDMDSEIEQLEKKFAKYQQIKQGMMQELLTGRIRLVDADGKDQSQTQAVQKKQPQKKQPQKKQPQQAHNQHFDDAVMIAGIVNAFYSEKYPLGRKKVQKLLYLVRRKEQADISAFHKKAAGPYADEVRYKGGEPIAQKNKYIQIKRNEKGSRFEKGVQMQQALTYLQGWGKQGDVDWLVSQFQYTSVNELELLATVDMAICDLRREGKEISVASIKDLIRSNKEWRDKLKKTISEIRIFSEQ